MPLVLPLIPEREVPVLVVLNINKAAEIRKVAGVQNFGISWFNQKPVLADLAWCHKVESDG